VARQDEFVDNWADIEADQILYFDVAAACKRDMECKALAIVAEVR
jgi:hypothetical protein